MLASCVHPVSIRSAVFCMACSLFVFVSDIVCDQIDLLYSSVVLVMVVYVFSRVSLDIPKFVMVRAFSIFMECSSLCLSRLVCV